MSTTTASYVSWKRPLWKETKRKRLPVRVPSSPEQGKHRKYRNEEWDWLEHMAYQDWRVSIPNTRGGKIKAYPVPWSCYTIKWETYLSSSHTAWIDLLQKQQTYAINTLDITRTQGEYQTPQFVIRAVACQRPLSRSCDASLQSSHIQSYLHMCQVLAGSNVKCNKRIVWWAPAGFGMNVCWQMKAIRLRTSRGQHCAHCVTHRKEFHSQDLWHFFAT